MFNAENMLTNHPQALSGPKSDPIFSKEGIFPSPLRPVLSYCFFLLHFTPGVVSLQ